MALNRDPRVVRFLTPGGLALSRAQTVAQLERFRRGWEEHGFGIWALEERATGRLVGRAGLSYHRLWPADPEVGWMLDPAVWGRGYATEAGAASLRHAFETLGFERVVSIVIPENTPSVRVMERLGIEPWRHVEWPEGGVLLDVRAIDRERWATRQAAP